MANIDLSGYNLSEVKGLQHNIDKEIKKHQHHDLQMARDQIMPICSEGRSIGRGTAYCRLKIAQRQQWQQRTQV